MWVPLGEYPKFGTTTYLLDKGSFFSGKRRKIFREQTDWVLFQGYGHFPFEYIYIYLEPQTTIYKWMFGDFQPFPK